MTVPSGLYTALTNSLTGLNVAKQQLAVASHNIANANTQGYSRQVVSLAANVIDNQGNGVKVDAISRQANLYLNRVVQQQSALLSTVSTLNDYASRIQILLGKPNGSSSTTTDTSIASAITGFFTNAQQLANTPNDAALRLSTVRSGENVAKQISTLATGLQQLRYQADQEITETISNVNNVLSKLQGVNTALAYAHNSGAPNSDLLDQRDKYLTELSQYVDINYYLDEAQAAHINTSGGIPLLDNARYELTYQPQSSSEGFANDNLLNSIQVYLVNDAGVRTGNPLTLVSGGASNTITTGMVVGKIKALLDVRDTKIPQLMEQLDQLAAKITDQVNTIHNSGSSYPGANSYVGTRLVGAPNTTGWAGSVRIALLDQAGQPVPSPYLHDTSRLTPLTLNLSELDSGSGKGYPTTQSIINAINRYYTPQNRVSLGDINDIQLTSKSTTLPGSPPAFSFDFNLQNLSGNSSDFFVTGVTVTDELGVAMTPVTSTQASVSLASTGTYITSPGAKEVTVTLGSAIEGLTSGDWIYLSEPSTDIDGIPAAGLSGFFQVTDVSGTSFSIKTQYNATAGGSWDEASMTATPKYSTVNGGENKRTGDDGSFAVSLLNGPTSDYYTITADVATQNADGTLSVGQIQYRVLSPSTSNINRAYGGYSAGGDAVLTRPESYDPMVTAELVDANGQPLPQSNGVYLTDATGYLRIKANNANYVIAIDSLDSQQIGFPDTIPPQAGTNRGFSYYFGLNNFFTDYRPTDTGSTVKGSAYHMQVESRLKTNPNLISVGQLSRSPAPSDGSALYTYERTVGDNSIALQMANLGNTSLTFTAAGGLGATSTSINGYAGQILSFASADATTMQSDFNNANTIMQGLNEQLSAASGVNLDEELANTIIYQNAYTASARVISVTNELFTTLISTFQ